MDGTVISPFSKEDAMLCAKNMLLTFVLAIALTGCYRMPKDGDYSTIPTTNNPDVVGSHQTPFIPGGGF